MLTCGFWAKATLILKNRCPVCHASHLRAPNGAERAGSLRRTPLDRAHDGDLDLQRGVLRALLRASRLEEALALYRDLEESARAQWGIRGRGRRMPQGSGGLPRASEGFRGLTT